MSKAFELSCALYFARAIHSQMEKNCVTTSAVRCSCENIRATHTNAQSHTHTQSTDQFNVEKEWLGNIDDRIEKIVYYKFLHICTIAARMDSDSVNNCMVDNRVRLLDNQDGNPRWCDSDVSFSNRNISM